MYKCGICNHELNDDIFVIDNVPEHTFEISDKTLTLNIAKCDNCHVVQLVGVPLSDTWMENYRSIGNTVEYREKKKEELKHFIDTYKLQDKAFLEVGCGDGQYLDIFRELGIESKGVEFGENNKKICKDKGYIIEPSESNSIDVVTCFYFLEHHPNPLIFLKSINNILKPDGLLYIEVPNYDYIKDHGLWLEFTRDHRFYYDLNSIKYLLNKCGFKIEDYSDATLCLTIIARKNNEFGKLKSSMAEEIKRFNGLTCKIDGSFAIVGAGHYTQLLLNQILHKPKYIYDSVPKKVGYKLCGIEIQHQDNIVNCDCENIIISCGMYNQEAYNNIKKLVPEKNIIIWE